MRWSVWGSAGGEVQPRRVVTQEQLLIERSRLVRAALPLPGWACEAVRARPTRVMSCRRSPRRGVSHVEGRRLIQPPGRAVLTVIGPAVLSAGLPVTRAVLRPGRLLFKMSAPLGGWRRCLGGTSETIPVTPRFLLETQSCEMKKSLQGGLRGGAHLANGGSRCR